MNDTYQIYIEMQRSSTKEVEKACGRKRRELRNSKFNYLESGVSGHYVLGGVGNDMIRLGEFLNWKRHYIEAEALTSSESI